MTKRSWIRNVFARPVTRPIPKAPHRARLVLEALEDRVVPVTFAPAVNYSGGGGLPRSVAVGDFNGDGKRDLATANIFGTAGNVGVLLGNGNGTFQGAVIYAAGSPPLSGAGPYSVAVGDFNNDSKQDLAVATNGSHNLSVLLGNGNGTFQSAVPYGAGTNPSSVAVGDFNGDGKQDLATANAGVAVGGSPSVSVLLGNGNGTFQAAVNYAAGSGPQSVAVGDFNADGKKDLAVANSGSGNVSVLLGNGNGTFGAAVNYAAGTSPYSVAVWDFNGDGKQDLAAANNGSVNVSVLLGNGNGTFGAAVNYAAGGGAASVALGDFNGDGRQDLATANALWANLSVLLGNGNGTFQSPFNYGAGGDAIAVAVGDFNGDLKPDLAVANYGSGNVSVLLNTTTPNTAPTIARNQAAVTGNEGTQATNTGTFDDAHGRATVTLTASLGTVTKNDAAGTWSWTYTPADGPAGPTTVTITATDSGGLTASTTFTLNVNNVAPTITISGAASVNEGATYTLTFGTVTDSGADTVSQYVVRWGDGSSTTYTTAGAKTHTYADGPATRGITVNLVDEDGTHTNRANPLSVTVSNVAPTITAFTVPPTGAEGSPVNLSATATDAAGAFDPLTYSWTVTRPDGTTFMLSGASASFTPPDHGSYGVSLTVSDGDGSTAIRIAPAGMVAWWRGEGNAIDSRGGNNGSLVGNVVFVAGRVGQAFHFNGGRIDVADVPSLDLTSAVTLEAWINPSSLAFTSGFGAIIAKSSWPTARNYGLFVKSNGTLHLSYLTTGGANVILETTAGLVPVGQFSHLAAVINPAGNSMQIYRNGQLLASGATGGPLVANAIPLTIGMSDGSNGFIGQIDEPAVYNRALSQTEIQSIINAGSAGKSLPVAVANVGDAILDNGSPGFSTSGPWLTYNGPEVFQGDLHFKVAGSGTNTATWSFTGLLPGTAYRVSATWFGHPVAATNAPFTITGGVAPLNVSVNQELSPSGFNDGGKAWQDLAASYMITGTTLTVTLSDLANDYVEADAVRIERSGYPLRFVDGGDAGFSTSGPAAWLTYAGPEVFQYDLHFIPAGTGANTATWTFAGGLFAGQYRVSATWFAHPLAATNAPFTVLDNTTALATVLVNQELAPASFQDAGVMWHDLGHFTISSGTLVVRLSDQANDYVLADAIRIQRVA